MPSMMHAAVLLADTLVSGVWIAAVLAVCVAGCLLLLPRLPARLRSWLWMVAFAVALVLPSVFLLQRFDGPAALAGHLRLHVGWALPVAFTWMALSLYRAYGLLRGAWHLRRVTQRATSDDTLSAWIAGEMTGRSMRPVQVRVSDEVDRPSVVGYCHPTILLPTDGLLEASESDLRQILLHELQHVRRFDDCTNLLQKIGVALFPVNPALLWMERRLCLERELACDDAVLEATGAPKAYATCLTHMAERSLLGKAGLLAVAAFGRPSELSRRVYRILQWHPRQQSGVVYGVASAVMLCGLGAGAVALERFGLPVSFADVLPSVASVETHPSPTVLGGDPARLVPVGFTLTERRVGAHASAHLNHRLVKVGHPDRRHSAARVGSPLQVRQNMETVKAGLEQSTSVPVEQLIEYTAVPAERDGEPVLQQISMPYAVIPTWSGWFIVQL